MKGGWRQVECLWCRMGLIETLGGIEDCLHCDAGWVWASPMGRIADYPGGPFRGSIERLPVTMIANRWGGPL